MISASAAAQGKSPENSRFHVKRFCLSKGICVAENRALEAFPWPGGDSELCCGSSVNSAG